MERATSSDLQRVAVERVVWRDPDGGFSVLRVAPEAGGPAFVAAGVIALDVAEGDLLQLTGGFEEHPRFGQRFRIATAAPRPPVTEEGLRRYLGGGRVKGIGPKLARRLVEVFGVRTLEILEREPGRVTEVPGIGRRKGEEIARVLGAGRDQREALVFLQGLGLGPATSREIWHRHGPETIARVQQDPYALCTAVRGVGFVTADRLAQALGLDPLAPARLRAGLVHALRTALDRGHVALPVETLESAATELLRVEASLVSAALAEALAAGVLVQAGVELPEFAPAEPDLVYLPPLQAAEEEAARLLLALAAAPAGRAPSFADAVRGGSGLTAAQQAAVELLLCEKVAVLTGGPGVGKTTVLRAVVRAFRAAGARVALASPTGRAARHLAEATGEEARTLHRLFGIRPDVPGGGSGEPLEADVLIVDEASMLDLPLLVQVLRRLTRATRLVLVGDPDQLPSVGPGSVLADVLTSGRFPTARLKEIFRQDRSGLIVRNAHRILAGQPPRLPERGAESDFFFIRRDRPEDAARMVTELFLERIPRRFGLDPRTDVQVLSPMHRGPAGVDALNAALQQALGPDRPAVTRGARRWCVGDRVMQVRNDYDREVMNGDLGVVESVDPECGTLVVGFEGRLVPYTPEDLDDLEVAFAVTVHKSQGGEFPAVILPLGDDHFIMLKRNVLYTAVTRARKLLVIVGSERALRRAIEDDRMQRRHGFLRRRLQGHVLRIVEDRR